MFIVALTPVIGVSLPALTPLIFAAAGALGYKAMLDMKDGGEINEALRQRLRETNSLRVKVDDLVLETMQEEIKRAEAIHFQKGDIVLSLIKDERGKLRVEASAPEGFDKKQLQEEARQFAEQIAQQFAQSRAIEELEKINAEVISEEVNEEEEIVLKVRRWV